MGELRHKKFYSGFAMETDHLQELDVNVTIIISGIENDINLWTCTYFWHITGPSDWDYVKKVINFQIP